MLEKEEPGMSVCLLAVSGWEEVVRRKPVGNGGLDTVSPWKGKGSCSTSWGMFVCLVYVCVLWSCVCAYPGDGQTAVC